MRLVVTFAMLVAFAVVPVSAQEKLTVGSDATVKSVLEAQKGKRVGVLLTTGQEVTGVVTSVGATVVHLSELTGREFFDAVVPLDRVSAVIVRTRR
jgi:hypothetical protein